jgi:hypothetical protein
MAEMAERMEETSTEEDILRERKTIREGGKYTLNRPKKPFNFILKLNFGRYSVFNLREKLTDKPELLGALNSISG